MKLSGLVLSKKRIVAGVVFTTYVGSILRKTLICREQGVEHQYNFELFWSWREFFDET